MAGTHREIETKFDVAPDFVLGDPADFAQPGADVQSRTVQLDSTYYDTAEQDLLRSDLSLRRRSGDADTGWHLKVPGAGFRTELHWPLAGNEQPPDELRRLIRPFTGGADLLPSVTLHTTRARHQVSDSDGRLVLELADDEVWGSSEGAPVTVTRWRELEAELGPAGTAADLAQATGLLLDRGAYLAHRARSCAGHWAGPDTADTSTAAAVLTRYLRAQCDALTAGHFAIQDRPFELNATSQPHEAVHQTRVATRRLRAVLRIFGPLFDAQAATRLAGELAWFAAELGEVRDREVLRNRLARAVEDLPAFLVVGPVAERIDGIVLAELASTPTLCWPPCTTNATGCWWPTWRAGASNRRTPPMLPGHPVCWPATLPPPSASWPSG